MLAFLISILPINKLLVIISIWFVSVENGCVWKIYHILLKIYK